MGKIPILTNIFSKGLKPPSSSILTAMYLGLGFLEGIDSSDVLGRQVGTV